MPNNDQHNTGISLLSLPSELRETAFAQLDSTSLSPINQSELAPAPSAPASVRLEPRPTLSGQIPGLAYRHFRVATTFHYPRHISDERVSICLDSGSAVSLIGQQCFESYFRKDFDLKRAPVPVHVSGITPDGHLSDRYADLEIRMRMADGQHLSIKGEFHVLPELPCNILIANDTLHTYAGILDLDKQSAAFGPTKLPVPISVIKAEQPRVAQRVKPTSRPPDVPLPQHRPRRARKVRVFATETVIVQPGTGINLAIRHEKLTPKTSHLFEPFPIHDIPLGVMGSAPKAVLNDQPDCIPFSNFGTTPIKIIKGKQLGHLRAINDEELWYMSDQVNMEKIFLGETDLGDKMPFILNPETDEPSSSIDADVSDHWGSDYEAKVRQVIARHAELFRPGLGMFNDNIRMPIPFRDETDIMALKQNPYNMSRRDRTEMDKILDPLVEDGRIAKIPLGQPSAASSPAFIVWQKGKPRVVVDLRRINSKLYPDAYPLPKQDDVLEELGGSCIFTALDIQKSYFQQQVTDDDRWKLSFVTPHRGHEWMLVASMGLANSPGFFQHRMETLLAKYLWQFVLVYIDDVIIYSRSIDEHLLHLEQVLGTLKASGISLSAKKCHFAYPSVKLLGHHVSRLGISTAEDKVEAIRLKDFPTNLRQLEAGLGFFNYYRKYVANYASIADPLNQLKTVGFRKAPVKGRARDKYADRTPILDNANLKAMCENERQSLINRAKIAWDLLKGRLTTAPILGYPDFSKPFILYTDGSYEHGFGAVIHQVQDGKEVPILYLSRCLKPSERNYWATELETAALVWALQKVPQYFDSGDFKVVTDHSALVSCLKSERKGRRAQRLEEWAMFLSTYAPRIKISHRPGKQHANADGMSRLYDKSPGGQNQNEVPNQVVTGQRSDNLEELLANQAPAFVTTALGLDDQFTAKIKQTLPSDKGLRAIFRKLIAIRSAAEASGEETDGREWSYHHFILKTDGLLWNERPEYGPRLCIPSELEPQIFEMAHDHCAHPGFAKAYDRIYDLVFIPGLREKLKWYIASCPACQLSKPSRDRPYGQLQPVPTPTRPFEVLSIDFVTGLPLVDGKNTFMSVTCKYTKYVRIIPGHESMTAEDWANSFFDNVVRHQHLPKILVSDRDAKFTGEFWQALFRRHNVKLHMTTAYHPSADGQAERSNQTIEIAMRCLLVGKYEEAWLEIIPEVEIGLNKVRSASTGISPFEAVYGFKPQLPFTMEQTGPASVQEFTEKRRIVRQDLEDALELANARMAIYFDADHRPPKFQGKVWIRLAKTGRPGYHLPGNSKLSTIRTGPYTIKRRVGDLAYELDLPEHTRLHPVISCIHLEQYVEDPHQRSVPEPGPIMVDGNPEWVVEKLLRQRDSSQGPVIEVKWKRHELTTWEPRNNLQKDIPELVRKLDERPKRGRPTKKR